MTQPAGHDKKAGHYYAVIDYMRAILILLVILVHIVHFGNLHPAVKAGILSFMMPAFLVITGYLVNINKSLRRFCVYLLQIFLPYVIMVVGYMIVSLHLPVRDGIATFDAPTVLRVVFIDSIGPYWFLRVMMVCGIVYYASFRLAGRFGPVVSFCLFATLLILLGQFTPLLSLKSSVYYFIGAGIKVFLTDFTRSYRSTLWAAVPFLLLAGNSSYHDWGTLAVLASVVCFFCFSSKLLCHTHGRLLQWLLFIGRNTLPIYIFHPIFTMAAKFYEPVFAFDPSGLLHAVATVALCVAGSLGIAVLMDRLHVAFVFGRKRIMR